MTETPRDIGQDASETLRFWLRRLPMFPTDLPSLDVAALPTEPQATFLTWLREVVEAGQLAARVMTLATTRDAGSDLAPDARNVLLTDIDERGWQFATHASSPKGRAIGAHPCAAATFFWPVLGRQVRIAGRVQRLSTDVAHRDFRERSDNSRASILVGRQSETLNRLDDYRVAFDRARDALANDADLVDSDWAVYAIAPVSVEFWQGSTTGPPIRVLYQQVAESWTTSQLYP